MLSPLLRRVFSQLMGNDCVHPSLFIVVKNCEQLPPEKLILPALEKLLNSVESELRTESFNAFVDRSSPERGGLYRHCQIFSPRSEKENLRVQTRMKKASRQLLSEGAATLPGILWLSLTEKQDPPALRDLISRRFYQGQFTGISSAILSQSGTHLEPPRRTVIDVWESVHNPRARLPLPTRIPIRGLDFERSFLDFPGVAAYRCSGVEWRPSEGNRRVPLPDLRRLAPAVLK